MPLSHTQIWKAVDALAARVGRSPSGLARLAGLDPTAFNPSKRMGPGDRPRWPSTESLTRVLESTGVSLGDFAALAQDAAAPRTTVPLLGLAQAGADGFFDPAGFPVGEGWDTADLPTPTDTTFALRIQGESMAPLYRPGDLVVVDRRDAEARRGDRVVVQTTDGEIMAKEIAAMTATRVTLASINPDHPPRTLPRSRIAWMARIRWVSQ